MDEKVASFIQKCRQKEWENEKKYHSLVLQYAKITTDGYEMVEVSEEEYRNRHSYGEIRDGKYLVQKQRKVTISDEDFTALENAIPAEKLAELKEKAYRDDEEERGRSGAATFLTVMAWFLWIGGFIVSLAAASEASKEFSFLTFMTTYIIYIIGGCFALCGAELFRKLQTIVDLLRRR